MKDLLSKEHHCYEINALLMKCAVLTPSSTDTSSLYGLTPFLQENLDSPSTIFKKSQTPINKGRFTPPLIISRIIKVTTMGESWSRRIKLLILIKPW